MTKETYMIEELTKDMIILLMEDRHISMKEALNLVYTSETYAKLCDTSTGLYFQSTPYVYEYLINELRTGKIQ